MFGGRASVRPLFISLRQLNPSRKTAVNILPNYQSIFVVLLHAVTETFHIGLLLRHMSLAAHRIAHDPCQSLLRAQEV
jgi:hypothetical protein